jgi:3-deoxy-D-manno-octulosonate 8-phosphate phosphatase (KDO 8-P phosphatase)
MIDLLIFDIDGTLTNGDMSYLKNGDEIKTFNAKDGLAIYTWNKIPHKISAFITGSNSSIIQQRATSLGVKYIYQNITNKKEILDIIVRKENINYNNIAIIGDDLNDYSMMNTDVMSFCPKDASFYIKEISNVILNKKGGKGAGREMIEYLLKRDPQALKYYLSHYIEKITHE